MPTTINFLSCRNQFAGQKQCFAVLSVFLQFCKFVNTSSYLNNVDALLHIKLQVLCTHHPCCVMFCGMDWTWSTLTLLPHVFWRRVVGATLDACAKHGRDLQVFPRSTAHHPSCRSSEERSLWPRLPALQVGEVSACEPVHTGWEWGTPHRGIYSRCHTCPSGC